MTTNTEPWEKEFDECFPVVQMRNYDAQSIVGQYDAHGNLEPAPEMVRLEFAAKMRAFIRTQRAKAKQEERERIAVHMMSFHFDGDTALERRLAKHFHSLHQPEEPTS